MFWLCVPGLDCFCVSWVWSSTAPPCFFNYPQRVVWTVLIRAQCLAMKDTVLKKGNYIRFSNQPWFGRALCELDSHSENPVSILLSNKELRIVSCIYLPLAKHGAASGEDADCPCPECLFCKVIGCSDRCFFCSFFRMTYLFRKSRERSCLERLCTVQVHSDSCDALSDQTTRGYHTCQVSSWLRGLTS